MPFTLLIVYIFLVLLRPQEWYEPLNGYQLVNVAAICTVFTTLISQSKRGNPLRFFTRNKPAWFMLGLFVAIVLSQLVRLRLGGALEAFTTFGKVVVLFTLTMILVDSPERFRKIMWVIILSALLLSVSAIMQVRSGYGFGGVTPYGSFDTGDFRVLGTGIFGDPNDFAMLYLMAIPFVFTFLQTKGNPIIKGCLLCSLAPFLYTLYYTGSRGAVAGLCALLLAYLWTGNRVSLPRILLTAAMLSAAIVLGPARARETIYEGSAAGRISAWGIGNEFLKESPLFGIGFMRWGDFAQIAPHNSFVECYAELGVVGYFFWFGLCWLVLRSLLRVMRLKHELGPGVVKLARGLFAALAGYLVSAFFLTHAYHPPLYFMLAMGIGLLRFVEKQASVPPYSLAITAKDIRWCVIFALLSIPTIWIIARVYWAGAA